MEPNRLENKALYKSNMNLWNSCEVVNLKQNFRVGKSPWNETLNRIRFGEQTEEDLKLLKSRYTSNFNRENWDDAIHAFFRNEDVQNHNIKMLNKMPGTLVTLKAEKPKGISKTSTKLGKIDTTQFANKLELKKGAKVMMIHNVDIADGLVNGVTGKVLDFAYRTVNGKPEVNSVIVKFDDEKIGEQLRKELPNFHPDVKKRNGVPVFKTKFAYKSERHGSQRKTGKDQWLRQYPLSLAFASTGNCNHNLLSLFEFLKEALINQISNRENCLFCFFRSQATRPDITDARHSLSWP